MRSDRALCSLTEKIVSYQVESQRLDVGAISPNRPSGAIDGEFGSKE